MGVRGFGGDGSRFCVATATLAIASSTTNPRHLDRLRHQLAAVQQRPPVLAGFWDRGRQRRRTVQGEQVSRSRAQVGAGRGEPGTGLLLERRNGGPIGNGDWPSTQRAPKVCRGANSVPCAYDYGWNAGVPPTPTSSRPRVSMASRRPTWPRSPRRGGSTSRPATRGRPRPTATVRVARRRRMTPRCSRAKSPTCRVMHVSSVGFYSTSSMWQGITGGSVQALGGLPVWIPGRRRHRPGAGELHADFLHRRDASRSSSTRRAATTATTSVAS